MTTKKADLAPSTVQVGTPGLLKVTVTSVSLSIKLVLLGKLMAKVANPSPVVVVEIGGDAPPSAQATFA